MIDKEVDVKENRMIGIDVARALAIYGMVIVNFKLAMKAETGSPFWLSFAGLFEGRASALFVVLAGIGVALLTRNFDLIRNSSDLQKARQLLAKRALLLIVLGLAYCSVWQADILHLYGFYFLVAAVVLPFKSKGIWITILLFLVISTLYILFLDFDKNWNWSELTYENYWTPQGLTRRVLLNGFHPIFPWAGFLLFGLWLGRLDLTSTHVLARLLLVSLAVFLIVEGGLYSLREVILNGQEFSSESADFTQEELALLLSSAMIPPLPQYMLSAASSAVVLLVLCVVFCQAYRNRGFQWLACAGKLSLTIYVAHVVLGLGLLQLLGTFEKISIEWSMVYALVFCSCATAFSVLWLRYFKAGPLELLFRKLASR